jgi:oxygen-dependent protoporphyrinogen oxidase
MPDDTTSSVLVIGAGITGLTAAFRLREKGVAVTVLEKSGRAGGAIQSIRREGFLAEFGPNTILETSPKITALIRDAGLQPRRIDPDPGANNRYLSRARRALAMPLSPLGMMTTPLFSLRAKLGVLREPFVPPRRDGVEETVAQFVERRLGREFLDRAVDALVGGIYAGDPAKLSISQALPKLHALEQRYGSLIKGQIFGAGERKRRGEIAKDRAPKFSFDEGLQVLPDTLAGKLGDAVRYNAGVIRLERGAAGWTVVFRQDGREQQSRHTSVLFAGTAAALAAVEIVDSTGTTPQRLETSSFSTVRYPPVASVVLGFRRDEVRHPLDGFGILVPRQEGFHILGTLFSSSLFPNRAPQGFTVLTTYVGGERSPELADRPEDELVAMTCADLRELLGVTGAPVFRHCVLYPHAIPQYNLGYGRIRERLTELEGAAPGLFFAGHYRDGVSLGDSIVSGVNVSERIEGFLGNSKARAT